MKLAIYYFSAMWKFRNLPLHIRIIYPTLTNFSALPFFALPMPKSVHVWQQLDIEVSTWFPITTPNWTSLWIPSRNLLLIHHINWFHAATFTDLQNEKKYIMWEVVTRRCPTKKVSLNISQNSQRNTCATVSFWYC